MERRSALAPTAAVELAGALAAPSPNDRDAANVAGMIEQREKATLADLLGDESMKRAFVPVMACAALLGFGCSTETQPSFADDLAAITGFNERYLEAINDEDIAALSALTTDSHVMLPPNSEPVVGKAANDALNGRAFERYEFSETWFPVETVVDGDLGFQRGTFTVIATPRDDGDPLEVRGSFLRIYQRQANGEWRMTRDMFNSSTPLTRTLSTGQ